MQPFKPEIKWPPPTVAQANQIAALTNASQRNLQITQAYYEFSLAFSQLFGAENNVWCNFATWASKTAGIYIRGDNAASFVQEYLHNAVFLQDGLASLKKVLSWFDGQVDLYTQFLTDIINSVPDEMSRQIAAGNVKVFAELGPLFAHMLEVFKDSEQFDQTVLDLFLAELRPGSTASNGQDLLRQAFTHYYHAIFAADEKTKAELILCGNLLIGYHEQTRLQDKIVAGMEAPLANDFQSRFIAEANQLIGNTSPRGITWIIQKLWRRRLKKLARQTAVDWRELTTKWLMTIVLPTETLKLGSDVPPLPGGDMYPVALQEIHLPQLTAVLAQVDRTPHSTRSSAARDWGNIEDRMNYIADLFRSRQQDVSLYRQPYDDEQVVRIHAGKIPEGNL